MASEDWNIRFANHWKNYPVPARPTSGELKIIEKYIIERKPKNVLILGATPEYRLLCRKRNLKVVCVDYSRLNFEIISRDAGIDQTETFVEQDWLKMDFYKGFDLILGDYVVNVLRKEDLAKFLDNLRKALRTGGGIFLKTHIAGDKPEINLVLKNYYSGFGDKNIYSATASDLMVYFMDEKGVVDFKKIIDWLEEQRLKNRIEKKDIEIFRKLCWESALLRLWFPKQDFLEKMLADRFNVKVYKGEKWMCKMLPLYRMEAD